MTSQTSECQNCEGVGHFDDVRYAGVTHRATPVRWKCRACKGTGQHPQLVPASEETWGGEIPDWMLGLEG